MTTVDDSATITAPLPRRESDPEPASIVGRLRRLSAGQWLDIGLVGFAVAVAGVALFIAAVHLRDRYHVLADFPWEDGHEGATSGVMMAFADALRHGHLYLPLQADGYYAGTRYAPLPIVMYTAGSFVTGEYLMSGKILAAVILIVLLVLLYRMLRAGAVPWPMALALVASVLVSKIALQLGTSPLTGDILPVIFQLGAVALIMSAERRGQLGARTVAIAGLLCALAVTAKLSELWAPVAIGIWLLVIHRRLLWRFAAVFVAALVVLFAGFDLASRGEMLANFKAVLFIAQNPHSPLQPTRLLELTGSHARLTALLLPFALLAIALAVRRRHWSLPVLSLLVATGITLFVLSDGGAMTNHIIDIVVLVPLVIGELWSVDESRSARHRATVTAPLALAQPAVAWLVAMSLLAGGGIALWLDERTDAKMTARVAFAGYDDPDIEAWPLAGQVSPTDRLLTVDPYVAVRLGERPVVVDPWMTRNLGGTGPAEIAARVDRLEFDKVVLTEPLEKSQISFANAWFGAPVFTALCQHYGLTGQFGGYYVYVPDAAGTPCEVTT